MNIDRISSGSGFVGNVKSNTSKTNIHKNEETPIRDSVELGKNQDSNIEQSRKVFGTIGTAAGVITGRTATPVLTAVAGGTLAGSVLGPIGTVTGAIAGLGVGAWAEYKGKIGRFVGGLLGGAVGSTMGMAAGALGHKPSEKMAEETKGFSFKSLFKKLWNPDYTSHEKLTSEEARKVIQDLKPGDLIITNNDGDYKFELVQHLMGESGNWTHIGIVDEGKKVLEVLISTDGPTSSEPERLFTENHHVVILRPDYKDPQSVKNTLDSAREYFGKATYDFKFRMDDDDKLYCQEYIYKAMQKGAPEIGIKTSKFLGKEFVSADDFLQSPDMKTVYTTGSNFWINFLSKFS